MTHMECIGPVIKIKSRFHQFCKRENIHNKEMSGWINVTWRDKNKRTRSSQIVSQLHDIESCEHTISHAISIPQSTLFLPISTDSNLLTQFLFPILLSRQPPISLISYYSYHPQHLLSPQPCCIPFKRYLHLWGGVTFYVSLSLFPTVGTQDICVTTADSYW